MEELWWRQEHEFFDGDAYNQSVGDSVVVNGGLPGAAHPSTLPASLQLPWASACGLSQEALIRRPDEATIDLDRMGTRGWKSL